MIHVAIWLMRCFGSFLDGAFGRFDLDWDTFHYLNWMRRDVPIFILYLVQYKHLIKPSRMFKKFNLWRLRELFLILAFWAVCHYAAHHYFYKLGQNHFRPPSSAIERLLDKTNTDQLR